MKKIALLLLLLVLISSTYFSQERRKSKEVAVTFYNFQQYGLTYKVGEDNRFWRFRLLNGGISLNASENNDPQFASNTSRYFSANLNTAIGRERRKEISPNINLIFGFDLLANYNFQQSTNLSQFTSTTHNIRAGIGGVLGIRYEINNKFFAGAELLPSAMYDFRSRTSNSPILFGQSSNNLSVGFNNNSALLSVGIRF